MKKHLKIFLTVIVSIFSFIFISNVKASDEINYHGFTINDDIYDTIWNYLENKTIHDVNSSINSDEVLHRSDFPYVGIAGYYSGSQMTSLQFSFLKQYHIDCPNSEIMSYPSLGEVRYFCNNSAPYFNQYWIYIDYNLTNKTFTYNIVNYWFTAHSQNDNRTYYQGLYNFDIYTKSHKLALAKNYNYESNPKPHTFNFHLNGGWVYDSRDGWGQNEDFSFTLYPNEVEDFIVNLEVKKYLMLFEGWYYDSGFTQPFTLNDHITSDVDLYAKFRYERVDDFLANTPLNKHTFDEHYNYAIINRGDNGDSVYIGLPFEAYNLEVYEFNESEYKVKDGASACPTPLYSKNGYYYYDINTLFTNNQEVLILPRTLFDELDPNNFENPNDIYNFYLSNNGYISYTNDLSQAQIINSSGEQISINLQDSYELSQQYQELYSKPENIFEQMNIFLDKMKKITSAVKDIIGYLFNSLNSTLKSFITFLVVLILITAIIRFARRG